MQSDQSFSCRLSVTIPHYVALTYHSYHQLKRCLFSQSLQANANDALGITHFHITHLALQNNHSRWKWDTFFFLRLEAGPGSYPIASLKPSLARVLFRLQYK